MIKSLQFILHNLITHIFSTTKKHLKLQLLVFLAQQPNSHFFLIFCMRISASAGEDQTIQPDRSKLVWDNT